MGFISHENPDPVYIGTFFVVGVPGKYGNTLPHAVTAKHVAENVDGGPYYFGVNFKDNKAGWLCSEINWWYHPSQPSEKSGRKIEREQASPDDLRFCDLGILPVKVVVGTKGCHEVVINELRNYWREPYTLTVEHCMRELPPPPKPVCEMLFRVSGFNGGWINKASMKFEKPLQSLQTDSEGRALLITVLDNDIKGTASAPGYIPKTFSISCAEPGEHEKIVKLAKR